MSSAQRQEAPGEVGRGPQKVVQAPGEEDGGFGPPPGDTGGVYAHLVSMKILEKPANTYALKLIAEGYDTAEAVDAMPLEELRDDFGVKKGHLNAIERYRNAVHVPVAATATTTATTTATSVE